MSSPRTLIGVCLIATYTAGCAMVRSLPECTPPGDFRIAGYLDHPVPPSKIAVAGARFAPRLTVQNHIPDGPSSPSNPVAAGAGVGAYAGLKVLTFCGETLGQELGALLFPVCAVVAGTAAVAGGAAGAVYAASANPSADQASAEEARQAYERQAEVESKSRTSISSIADLAELNRVLVGHIQRHAAESGLGGIAELKEQGPGSPGDLPRYETDRELVLEVMLSERIFVAYGNVDDARYSFGFSARGRLVRVSDSAEIGVFTTTVRTSEGSARAWAAGDQSALKRELDDAVSRIARTAVEGWIRPATRQELFDRATVVVIRPAGSYGKFGMAVPLSLDGCYIGSLAFASDLMIRPTPGRHLLRTEDEMLQVNTDLVEHEIDVKAGEMRYVELNVFRPTKAKTIYSLADTDRETAYRYIDGNVSYHTNGCWGSPPLCRR